MNEFYLAKRRAQLACPYNRPTKILDKQEILAMLTVDAAVGARASVNERPTIEMKAVRP
jgi:hypothetical protein